MANLRDRGYGNSMEGLQLKKAPERHTRKKTVVPGEANVSKGHPVQPTRSMPSYGSVPEYSPVYPVGNAGTPLNLQFSDVHDEGMHESNVEVPFQKFNIERDIGKNQMSLDEIRRRMQELERALSSAYDSQRDMAKMSPYTDYKWDEAEMIDDNLLGLNADEPTQQLAFMNYQKAARTGEAMHNAPAIDRLFFEYNNLKNEYNARLAQYLQGMR